MAQKKATGGKSTGAKKSTTKGAAKSTGAKKTTKKK